MLQLNDVREVEGMDVTDPDGNRIGTVETVYLDNETDRPEFALVNTGWFGNRSTFVPLDEAQREGDHLRVPHSKDQVKDAPNIEADAELSPEEEARIYDYYGMPANGGQSAEGDGDRRPAGQDTSGPTTDDAMTRSEEEVHVGKTDRETGRARLRKFVETEPVTERVQTRREEVHVEREPVTEGNLDEATSGPEISEEEHEVTLHEEEPVVEKRTVPKERVRMEKEDVTEEQEVSDEVRKERIEADEEPRS